MFLEAAGDYFLLHKLYSILYLSNKINRNHKVMELLKRPIIARDKPSSKSVSDEVRSRRGCEAVEAQTAAELGNIAG